MTVETEQHTEHSLGLRESLSKSVLQFRPAAVEFRIYAWPSRQAWKLTDRLCVGKHTEGKGKLG